MASKHIESSPVTDRERLIIENNEQTIVKLMDPDKISRLLMHKGVIDNDDRKQILVPPGASERNRVLVGMLLVRGPDAFKNYVSALSESGTDNHSRLADILRNNPHPADEMIQNSRHKRISEKIDNHELRLKVLEEGVNEIKSDEDVESIRAELIRRNTELDELREQLKTRDGELKDAREENKALQKRIQTLEKRLQSLETHLKDQKLKNELLAKQQQQDRRNIRQLEDKNAKLEARMDAGEKKMEKRLQEQEKRHNKEMDEIRQLIRHHLPSDSSGSSKQTNTASRQSTAASKGVAAAALPKLNFTPKNRFQQDEQAPKPKAAPPAQPVRTWKRSTADPERLQTTSKPAQKKK